MKKIVCLLSIMFSITAMHAQAGFIIARPVVVNDNLAYGSIVGSSKSNNSVEYLGCSIYASGSSFVNARCFAKNSIGKQAYCSTTNANLIEAIGSISTASLITIRWGNDGRCTAITVTNDSRYYSE